MCILETRQLRKIYASGEARVESLRGVDFTVEEAEFVAIMGRSGSGKSTLLQLLGGIIEPTSGHVLLKGTDLAGLDDDQRTGIRRHHIGFIFQSFNLVPVLTVEENVSLPLELAGVTVGEAHRRARGKLDLVEMTARRSHLPSELSGGEQQRVAIARALVTEPAIVLADEPTGNLDSISGRRVIELMRSLVDDFRQTIVMVTHDSSVAAYADRVVYLADGLAVIGELSGEVRDPTLSGS